MMDSDDELESFQITEDDLYNELNPNRHQRRFTKEDAMLGMWASRDSDDEDDTRGYRHKKDYSRPLNFVTSQSANDEDNEDSDKEDIDAQMEYIMDKFEQKKMQAGGEKAGIGNFKTASLKKNRELHMFQTEVSRQTTKKTSASNNKTSGRGSKGKPGSLVEKRKRDLMVSDKDWGRWEKYSSGFGSRMMQKMGYVPGQGLGKRGEGIVNPVKAVKNVELGQSGPELSRGPLVVAEDSEEEEEQEAFQKELQQWQRKDGEASLPRPKYIYKTADDLRESSKRIPYKHFGIKGQSATSDGVERNLKVIDMTGKETRILNSYSDLSKNRQSSTRDGSDQVFVPELMHNLQLLVSQTEDDIVQSDRKFQYNQDMVINLTHERNRLEQVIEEEKDQVNKLSEITGVISIFEDRLTADYSKHPLSLSECEDLLTQLQDKYPNEYKIYKLSSLAVAIVFPILKRLLEGWDILKDHVGPFTIFQQWRELLRESQYSSSSPPELDQMDAYDRLIWEVWMPKFRQVLTTWSPKTEVENLVDMLERWMPLLPEWILNNILESIILPKLQQEVDSWDPTTDHIPIHSWIHPWLPIIDNQLEILYPPIRMKLGVALNNWQPSDSSALVILRPWAKIFSSEVMEAFLSRTVLPKLMYCLQTLVINPQQQNIAPIEWVLQWRELIPVHHFINMFDKYFFPKWLQVLNNWLSGNPNYDEVTKWYIGWKSMFDTELLADQTIKANFNRALSLMDHAVHGTFVPGMRENMTYFTTSERRRTAELQNPTSKVTSGLSSQTTISFKDIIERKAEELGILFIPTSKRYEGKTLYTFGDNSIYIDRGVIFTMTDRKWTPVSIDELIERSVS